MKKLLLPILLLFAFIGNAQTSLMDNFNYTNDSLAAVNVNNGWIIASGTTTNALRANATALTYTGYVGSGVGFSVPVTTSGQDVVKDLKTNYTANSVYASFIGNVSAAQATGDYFFGMLPTGSTTLFTARTFIKLQSTGYYKVGIMKGSATLEPVTAYSTDSFATGVNYLFVVKYTFYTGTSTDDSLKVYVFNSGIPATEPATPRVATIGGTNTDATSINRVFIRQGTATNAPSLTIGSIRVSDTWANGPLAVKMSEFKAVNYNNNVLLSWSTSSETNNKGFEVQRSLNGTDFNTIGFVNGAGNSNKLRSYQFTDENSGAPVIYYRLNQIDHDGKSEYSEIIAMKNEGLDIHITPNPFADQITINSSNAGAVINAEVIDLDGKVKMTNNSVGNLNIDTRTLAQGIYFIRVNNGENLIIKRIIKN